MPAYNFKKIFAPAVRKRQKRQTIRARRKATPTAGQTAYCYTGMRTKACTRLGAWVITRVRHVVILDEGVILDGGALRSTELHDFAKADGFSSWAKMKHFFLTNHDLPFHGDLIMWD